MCIDNNCRRQRTGNFNFDVTITEQVLQSLERV